jgi:16S rRNA (uracil1498-N3)-methyltransferase
MAPMPRIHVEIELTSGAECVLPAGAAHHVRDVLRLEHGAELVLFNGRGGEYVAQLLAVTRGEVRAVLGSFRDATVESPLAVTLVQSISRGERMDYTIQKAVELGVQTIVPITSTRTVVRLDSAREEKRLEHWRGIVRHAAEQSGRTAVPELTTVLSLAAWLAKADNTRAYMLDPFATTSLAAQPAPSGEVAIVAGPEGGFSGDERAQMARAGVIPVRLGPRVLRTETAALCALTILQMRWGDLS